jgi:hypothetical protein
MEIEPYGEFLNATNHDNPVLLGFAALSANGNQSLVTSHGLPVAPTIGLRFLICSRASNASSLSQCA